MSLVFETTALTGRTDLADLAGRAPAGPMDPRLVPALTGDPAAIAQLEAGARCVTTGQQPGLLGGPLYTLHKAATAIALARRVQAVPVFWVAGDDHDFAEANHADILTNANVVDRLTLRDRPENAPLTPLYREPVGNDIQAILEAVTARAPETEFRAAVLDTIRTSYAPDTDLATAFARLLAVWFGPYGLVVFCPTHAAAKTLMAPWLLRALEQADAIDAGIVARARALEAAGAPVPVHVGDRATLVMVEGDLGRDRLVRDGNDLVLRRSGERLCLDDVRALAQRDPQRLSPNVLLRPVVEAAMLPTIAYVGGPGELAYFPQCDPVYTALGVTPQARVPRWSARIIETKVQKVLDKYAIRPDDLGLPEGQLAARLVREALPPETRESIRALRLTIDAQYDQIRDAAVAVDPTLRKPVESQRGQALAGLADVEKRIVHHLKQQNDVLVQQLDKARVNLFPRGKPQERVLGAVPFLIRYGPAFLEQLVGAADAWVATWSGSSAR